GQVAGEQRRRRDHPVGRGAPGDRPSRRDPDRRGLGAPAQAAARAGEEAHRPPDRRHPDLRLRGRQRGGPDPAQGSADAPDQAAPEHRRQAYGPDRVQAVGAEQAHRSRAAEGADARRREDEGHAAHHPQALSRPNRSTDTARAPARAVRLPAAYPDRPAPLPGGDCSHLALTRAVPVARSCMPRPSPSVNSAGMTNTSSTCLASARTKPTGTGASMRTTRSRRKYWPGVKPNSVTEITPIRNQISRVRSALTPCTISAEMPTPIIQSTNSAAIRRTVEASDPAPSLGSPSCWPGYSEADGSPPVSGPLSQEPVMRAMTSG